MFRSPHRPANIGLTLAKVEHVKGDTITMSGVRDLCEENTEIDHSSDWLDRWNSSVGHQALHSSLWRSRQKHWGSSRRRRDRCGRSWRGKDFGQDWREWSESWWTASKTTGWRGGNQGRKYYRDQIKLHCTDARWDQLGKWSTGKICLTL